MPGSSRSTTPDRGLVVPFVLLGFCLLALLVCVFGLYRTSSVAQTRFSELEVSLQALRENDVEATELLATDRLLHGVTRPVPAIVSASQWSLAMTALSLVFLLWLLISARAALRSRESSTRQDEHNDHLAMSTLLDQIAPLASGDLDVHATAKEGTPGALADAVNYAVGELRTLAGSQRNTSRALTESLGKLDDVSESIVRLGTGQSEQIHDSSGILLTLSRCSSELSEHAAEAALAGKKVLDNAFEGASWVSESVERIHEIRRETEACNRLMQALASHADGIEENVGCIDDVTRRTRLLVLNTTLRATNNGRSDTSTEALSDISQLADEMASFADEIARCTSALSWLARSVSTDNSQALSLLRAIAGSLDVHLENTIAMQHTLDDMQCQSQRLQLHTDGLSGQAVENASGVKELSVTMDRVNQVTQQMLLDVKGNAEILEALKRLGNDLRQSLADFSLSDTRSAASDITRDAGASGSARSIARRAADRAVLNE